MKKKRDEEILNDLDNDFSEDDLFEGFEKGSYFDEGLDYDVENRFDENKGYLKLHQNIVKHSFRILYNTINNKCKTKAQLKWYFIGFLSIQFIAILIIILKNDKIFRLSDEIIITLIISVFVETLAVVGFMVKFYFISEEEIEYIKTIQKVAEKYKRKNDSNIDEDEF